MKTIRCIVLEDEEPAQNLIRHYAKKTPEIELVEVFDNAVSAFDFLESNSVDLIFTDIEMPRLNGLDFIRMLSFKPQIIIITAYPQHALESYDLNVTDYLKKPVSFDRFINSIEKVKRNCSFNTYTENDKNESSFILVKENGKTTRVELEDIIYIEAYGDYVKIINKDRTIITLSTMTKMEENLPSTIFIRTHKSFIINIHKIHSIDSANSLVILNNKKEITLGRAFKQNFMAQFKAIN